MKAKESSAFSARHAIGRCGRVGADRPSAYELP